MGIQMVPALPLLSPANQPQSTANVSNLKPTQKEARLTPALLPPPTTPNPLQDTETVRSHLEQSRPDEECLCYECFLVRTNDQERFNKVAGEKVEAQKMGNLEDSKISVTQCGAMRRYQVDKSKDAIAFYFPLRAKGGKGKPCIS